MVFNFDLINNFKCYQSYQHVRVTLITRKIKIIVRMRQPALVIFFQRVRQGSNVTEMENGGHFKVWCGVDWNIPKTYQSYPS